MFDFVFCLIFIAIMWTRLADALIAIAVVEVGAIFHCESVQSELVATCAVVTGQKQSQLLNHQTKPKQQNNNNANCDNFVQSELVANSGRRSKVLLGFQVHLDWRLLQFGDLRVGKGG